MDLNSMDGEHAFGVEDGQRAVGRVARAVVKAFGVVAASAIVVGILPLVLSGCGAVYFVGMPLVYDSVRPDGIAEFVDERYFDGPGEADEKTRLDLFLPDGEGWPAVVFVHGGGWSAGDKDLRVGGKDVYRNIGRRLASQGIGAAIINYRLIPGVHWTTQLRDVAHAVLYTRERVAEEGGDVARLFVSGHSAGAQLAARVALDGGILAGLGGDRGMICGVIAVSGAGFDMEDQQTYDLGAKFEYLERRFGQVDGTDSWPHDASVIQYVDASSPPFLIAYGGGEEAGLQRQSELFADVLEKAGVAVDTVVEPGYSHARMVLALSGDDKQTSKRFAEFVHSSTCGTAHPSPR